MTALQAAGLSVTAVLLAKMLERHTREQAMLLTLLLGILLTGTAVLSLSPVLTRVDSLLTAGGLAPETAGTVGKAIGICCVTELAADTCKDAGESALSAAVLLTGKTALLLLALPLIEPVLHVIGEVLTCAG